VAPGGTVREDAEFTLWCCQLGLDRRGGLISVAAACWQAEKATRESWADLVVLGEFHFTRIGNGRLAYSLRFLAPEVDLRLLILNI
jgi:hypothetical protein